LFDLETEQRMRRDQELLKNEAREKFDKGREAFKKGDYQRALVLFRRSYDRFPRPGTLINLAMSEEKLGMTATAWQHFREVMSQLPVGDARVSIAGERAAALEPRVPWCQIRLLPGAPADTVILLNGRVIPRSQLNKDMPVDPGKHVVSVRAPGKIERWHDVTLSEGGREVVVIAEPKSGSPGALVVTLGVVGWAGFIAGAATGAAAAVKYGDAEDPCVGGCSEKGEDTVAMRNRLIAASIASMTLSLGAGVGLSFVLSSSGESKARAGVYPALLPGGFGLGVAAAW
jgi:hypothetical protein